MAEMPIVNIQRKEVDRVDLPDGAFDYPVKRHLLYEAVRHYLAAGRAGTHKVKSRVEVRGGGRATHGSMFHRAPGSVGQSAFPSKVLKGMRGPGQMGDRRITVKGIEVVRVDAEQNLVLVRGAVPGAKGSLVEIKRAPKAG